MIERSPSTILGRSLGFSGSVAIFTTERLSNRSARNAYASSPSPGAENSSTIVAVFETLASTPSSRTQLPALACVTGILYRVWYTHSALTVATAQSSSSSGEYASPKTRTVCPARTVPDITRASASKAEQSSFGYSLATITRSGPEGSHARIDATARGASGAFCPKTGPAYAAATFAGAPSLAVGQCALSASTSPAASPKILRQARRTSGLTFILYSLGLSATLNSASTAAKDAACSPTACAYTLYRGSRTNCTNERSPPPGGGLARNARASAWKYESPHSRLANFFVSISTPRRSA